jgi:hypothetical protein
MNIGKSDKNWQNLIDNSIEKDLINFSKIVIPFSKAFKSNKQIDIYSGQEKIPFNERDPDYKMILKQEFSNSFNIEFKVFRSVINFPSF